MKKDINRIKTITDLNNKNEEYKKSGSQNMSEDFSQENQAALSKQPIVHVEDFTMAYTDKPVIWDIDLDIYENSITAIIGPNGAGKSTLIKGILRLLKPVSGRVLIMGKPYKEVYKNIAYIPQSGSVNWNFPTTVLDVVMMGRYTHLGLFKRPGKKEKELAFKALEKMKMVDFSDRQISELSGGQRQRVFLARAIAQDALIYFMDEPLQGVDIKTESIIVETMREFKKEGKTIIVVHHDLSTLEDYFDHVVIINKQLVAAGRTEDVFTKENLDVAYGE
ncbi:hypothetical protein HMPREF9333_00103 [Johnsonella ignava ATCC 51276]|uniref:ABC transporter domain-containing protein n=2 Tax=Johnsonella TaxID=43994 RepID=G5GEW5_9FIRM|nr:metal ABC transporter ATP-binding protein [Johnsonella ignava]EHI56656.1 hypothetical protein HMPREF9333_00103 [Johnsonella ignava ATCC 51276]